MSQKRGHYEVISATGAWEYDLLAAIVRRAVQDAKSGNASAVWWLDSFIPEWRRYNAQRKERVSDGNRITTR